MLQPDNSEAAVLSWDTVTLHSPFEFYLYLEVSFHSLINPLELSECLCPHYSVLPYWPDACSSREFLSYTL